MKKIICTIIVSVMAITSSATIINVPADYPTIQQGIDVSADGDTVLVQPGTYFENINFNGHNIVLGSLFLTTGDTSYIGQTVIDGDSAGSVVTFENGEDSSAVITGFNIRNGYANFGGGVFCHNSSPVLSHNIISYNGSDSYGGGIGCYYSDPIIVNNVIENDSAYYFGGGIHCLYSNPLIKGNSLRSNKTFNGGGGGIGCYESSPIINDNVIVNNIADANESGGMGGGILAMSNSLPVISGNFIVGNFAFGDLITSVGGGIFSRNSQITLLNNIISFNSATEGGAFYTENSTVEAINNIITNTREPIYCTSSSHLRMVNSIVYYISNSIVLLDSSTGDISYSDIQGTWTGPGNISVDPRIYNVTGQLRSIQCGFNIDSPCIDAGDPNILDSLLDCSWGLGGPRSDMGAYGGGDSATVGIVDDSPPPPGRLMLLQNYPNPFNAQTTIEFTLKEETYIELLIFDLLGREVTVLERGFQFAGNYKAHFSASGYTSGVYFLKLRAGDTVETGRMILLK